MQKAPSTFGLTSPQLAWQNAEMNLGLSARLRELLTRFAMLKNLVADLPEEDWKEAASSRSS